MDGNILRTQIEGCKYDRDVSKHVKLYSTMNYENLCATLFSKMRIDSSKYYLKLYYRSQNPYDMKFGIVPIDDDDDVELMFGVVISKGTPFFVELYLEKYIIGGLDESSERNVETSSSRERIIETSSSRCLERQTSSSRGLGLESGGRIDESTLNISSFDESILRTMDDVSSAMELRVGMMFDTKEELIHAVREVHMRSHQEFIVSRSNALNWQAVCKWKELGCDWSLRARFRKESGLFQIMECFGPHTCMSTAITQDHPNLGSSDIVGVIKEQVIADPSIKEKVLLATAKNAFGYEPGRKKIRNAKKLIIEEVHGSWDGSYEELPHLMEALQSFNIGTKIDWLFKENEESGEDVGELEVFLHFRVLVHMLSWILCFILMHVIMDFCVSY